MFYHSSRQKNMVLGNSNNWHITETICCHTRVNIVTEAFGVAKLKSVGTSKSFELWISKHFSAAKCW